MSTNKYICSKLLEANRWLARRLWLHAFTIERKIKEGVKEGNQQKRSIDGRSIDRLPHQIIMGVEIMVSNHNLIMGVDIMVSNHNLIILPWDERIETHSHR